MKQKNSNDKSYFMQMVKHCFRVILFSGLLSACSYGVSKQNTDNSKTNSPDSSAINFLKWYRSNEQRLDTTIVMHLVKGGTPDATTFYSVDFPQTEMYLNELKKSGFLSDAYLDDLRHYFLKSNDSLRTHLQNDGPPIGFEADLVMKSQDYMDVWDNLDKNTTVTKTITGNKALVTLHFIGHYSMQLGLSKYGDKWLIDVIETPFDQY